MKSMKLLRADIQNYRSIKSVTLTFEPSCRILVGVNESGKSNILRALAELDPEIEIVDDDLRVFGHDENHEDLAFIRFVFGLDTADRQELLKRASSKILGFKDSRPILELDGKDYTLKEYIAQVNEGLFRVDLRSKKKFGQYYTPSTKWKAKSGLFVCSGCPAALQVVVNGSNVSLSKYKLADDSIEELPDNLVSATTEDITKLVGTELAAFVVERLPPVVWWEYQEKNLLPTRIGLDAFAANPDSCMPLKHMFALANFNDAEQAIEDAKKRSNGIEVLLEKVADKCTRHMRGVWKEMKSVSIQLRENGSHIECKLRDSQFAYDFERRSDGFKRFFTFLLMISARTRTKDLNGAIYLHDEPEIGLHPSGAKHLRDELIRISKDNIVVFSTHSIHMIDKELPERHLVVKKDDEITRVLLAENSAIAEEEVLFQALGTSVFEDLKPKNLIFEGWRDFHLFRTAMGDKASIKKLSIDSLVEAGACYADGLKDVACVATVIQAAGRRSLIVSDGDAPAKDKQRRYEGSAHWTRYDECSATAISTAEDFLESGYLENCLEAACATIGISVSSAKGILGASSTNKLETVRSWLVKQGVVPDQTKEIINETKRRAFRELKPKHILQAYHYVLTRLNTDLGQLRD